MEARREVRGRETDREGMKGGGDREGTERWGEKDK